MSTQPVSTRFRKKAPAAPLTPTTAANLKARIAGMQMALVLYRAGTDWYRMEYGGVDFWIPPDLGGELGEHPVTQEMVPCDGQLEVRDQYGVTRDHQTKLPKEYGVVQGMDAVNIVLFSQNVQQHVGAGVVWLEGNDQDQLRRQLSAERVKKSKLTWAESEVHARREIIANWQRANPGVSVAQAPPMTPSQTRAQELMDSIRAEAAMNRGAYVCEYEGDASDSFVSMKRHREINHPDAAPLKESDEIKLESKPKK